MNTIIIRIFHFLINYRLLEMLQVSFIGLFGLAFIPTNFVFSNAVLIFSAIFLQIMSAFYLNDFCDWKNDGKMGAAPKLFLRLSILAGLSSIAIASTISRTELMLLSTMNLISFLYSSPPFILKRVRPMPLVLHFIMGVLYFVSGTTAATGHFNLSSSDTIWIFIWGSILASGSLSNELCDRESDLRAGIRTIGQSIPEKDERKIFLVYHLLLLISILLFAYSEERYLIVKLLLAATGFYLFLFLYNLKKTFRQYRASFQIFFAILILVILVEKWL